MMILVRQTVMMMTMMYACVVPSRSVTWARMAAPAIGAAHGVGNDDDSDDTDNCMHCVYVCTCLQDLQNG